MVECRQGHAGGFPRDVQPELGSYPADEFDAVLRHSLHHHEHLRQHGVLPRRLLPGRFQSCGPPLLLRFVDDALFAQLLLDELQQIHRQADELRLHALGRGAAGPGFLLPEFVLYLIETFLNIPAHLVELGDDAGRHAALQQVGQILVGDAGEHVEECHTPQQQAASGAADEFIPEHACIDRVCVIKGQIATLDERHVRLATREHVDAAALLPLVPLGEVDASPVPDIEDFATLPGTLPQRVDGLALESADIVFPFARELVVDGEVAQGAVAQVARVEMADGVLAALAVSRIMRGMSVVVTITGVDVEACEAGEGGQCIGQHQASAGAEPGVEFGT